jgi:hypothetical protein
VHIFLQEIFHLFGALSSYNIKIKKDPSGFSSLMQTLILVMYFFFAEQYECMMYIGHGLLIQLMTNGGQVAVCISVRKVAL